MFNDELGQESLQLRHWFKKLCYFYKFYKNESPQYLFKLVPLRHLSYTTVNAENKSLFKTKLNFFKIRFLPQLLSIKTVLTIMKFKESEAFVLLEAIFWNLSGQSPIVFLIVKIIEESNSLQDCVLALVICANTNSQT